MNYSNICVLGADKRMDFVAQKFYDLGYDVYRDLENCDKDSIVILPPPVGEVSIRDILPNLMEGQSVYGGAVSNRFIHECKIKGITAIDYLKWDEVTAKNALLTAKGVIKEAETYKAVQKDVKCLVTGYGFCGKAIAGELSKTGAYIDVMVRRRDLKSLIEQDGFGFIDINDSNIELAEYDFIFNTVPALVLDYNMLQTASTENIIIDIASAPGGTDFSYCKENNITAVLSLGIPGKVYPKEAGEIIADAIISHINSI